LKLVTFLPSGSRAEARVGVLLLDSILDVSGEHERLGIQNRTCASMLSVIQGGASALATLNEMVQNAKPRDMIPLAQVTLLAPLPRPEQVRCFSAFEEHAVRSAEVMLREIARRAANPEQALADLAKKLPFKLPKVFYERPLYYKGNRFSVVGPGATVEWPKYSGMIDFELELGCVIGKQGKDISQADAGEYVFGYTVCNDLSARDEQAQEMQAPLGPAKGKDFDGGLCVGPCIVTADEFERERAEMIVRVNGEEWSRGRTRDMYHSFEQMIAYVSRSETLYPGELFLSGCVGLGSGVELQRFPKPGDAIELEITGIGKLSNRIVQG
jgi:2-keto-4-pentenoate hydratase/2-oxohepta-3-ene-1,7-dioic acid hydratase in catechol pathway